jgi:cellulose synthase/poly-beta-1,6-N-acetylglucosamine synthase-like glycosyltransferase
MLLLEGLLVSLFVGSLSGVLLVFGLYPLVVTLSGWFRAGAAREPGGGAPSASLLVALRNAEALAGEKMQNALALEPPGALEIVFVSDGSTDRTVEVLRAAAAGRAEVLEVVEHEGKAHALNLGAARCRHEILVFSDADALLAPDALRWLLGPFVDPAVGGVCGQRVIQRGEGGALSGAQGSYIAADSAVKRAESRLGSVTSNDGKLYAVRRELFRPIAPGATDDLYSCLSIVEQGRRFVFEPRALAFIRTPSRSARHELGRRRRIVSRSLNGIARKRALLNPLRHGFFAFQLLVNKVCRRLLPLFLVGLFLSSLALSARPEHVVARALLLLQLAFYALALAHPLLAHPLLARVPIVRKASSTAWYFCVGNLGTLLGLADFLRGKEAVKWDPIKSG